MSDEVTNYQCPACTGPLHFDGDLGKLKCDYCDSTFEVAEIEAHYAQPQVETQESEAADQNTDWGEDAQAVRAYHCPSCGAELICDATTAATACPYCDNPSIVPGRLSGALKPDVVIPFKLDKDAAVAALKRHYKGKIFLPRAFRTENHLQELKGLYVPFWLFDGVAEAQASYVATRSHMRRHGNVEVTTTEHYQIDRAGSFPYAKVPVDGSSKMPDDYMDSIEPFDYAELKPFSAAYLPGFFADRYDVSADESAPRAQQRCANSALDSLRRTVVGYQTCVPLSQEARLRQGKVRYALMPVWMLNTRWKGRDFLFAMNGQTGKLVGDLPVSWGRFFALLAAISVGLAAVATLVRLLAGLY